MNEPLDAGARLHRLLAVLVELAHVGHARIDDLAARFEMAPETLVAELELAACCGLPPYTPDQLLELVVDDGTVHAYGLEALSRPAKLTPEEGLAVAAAARALLAVPGARADGALGRALSKLQAVLGEDRLAVEANLSEHATRLQAAIRSRELLEIDYLGAFRGRETTRVVEPHALRTRDGALYLDAWCHLAEGWRRFALERVVAVRSQSQHFLPREIPEELEAPGAFSATGRTRSVDIVLPAERARALEGIPAEVSDQGDGRVLATVAVGDEDWLGLLLLRLGEDAHVLGAPDLADARRRVARRALARYQRETPRFADS